MLIRVLLLLMLFNFLLPANASTFNDVQAKIVLRHTEQQLKTEKKMSFSKMKFLHKALQNEVKQAESCIAYQEKRLANFDKTMKLTSAVAIKEQVSDDIAYLKKQQRIASSQYGTCRLFQLQANEVLDKLEEKIVAYNQHAVWIKSKSVFFANWRGIIQNPFKKSNNPIDIPISHLLYLSLMIGLWLTILFSSSAQKIVSLLQIKLKHMNKLLYQGGGLVLISATISLVSPIINPSTVQLFLLFVVLTILGSIYIKNFTIGMIEHQSFFSFLKPYIRAIKYGIYGAIALFVSIYLVGYVNLAILLSVSLFKTIIIVFSLIFTIHVINRSYHLLFHHQYIISKITEHIASETNLKIPEILISKYLLLMHTLYQFLIMLINSWDITHIHSQEIEDLYNNGFVLLNIYIIPAKIVDALLLYAFLGLLIRFAAKHYSNRQKPKKAQPISPIIINIGFIIAALVSLLMAGVNLTGLAIVAGALSVGIGLGLKSIVNNFISGIILLIEKPIKVGDRIQVGNAEGIVSRIRIRATEIKTRDRSDVLIPNEDIITNQLTNYMLKEAFWRIQCPISVAYGSDVNQVKKLLLEVAQNNDEVINDDETQLPNVLFKSFDDFSITFVLRCIIKNVNRKNFIISDLNTEIERVFREHNIEIPFPRTDIHFLNKDT